MEKVLTMPEVIEALDNLTNADQEIAHEQADKLLVDYLEYIGHGKVADAWGRTRERVGFWYS